MLTPEEAAELVRAAETLERNAKTMTAIARRLRELAAEAGVVSAPASKAAGR